MEHSEVSAVLDWVSTFGLDISCESLDDLADGSVVARILNEIAPQYFDISSVEDPKGNWVLASENIKKLIKMIDRYFLEDMNKVVHWQGLDSTAIARDVDVEHILLLIEIVIGAAVMCDNKSEYIGRIFSLEHDSQAVLKSLIEHAMARICDFEGEELLEPTPGEEPSQLAAETSEDYLRSQELVRHLQEERLRLLHHVAELEERNSSLTTEAERLRTDLSQQEQERKATEGSDRNRIEAAASAQSTLRDELEEAKRELDVQTLECESLRATLKAAQQKMEASLEIQAKLEMENHHMCDELDILREKAAKLVKAETSVEKYQKKLEEMMALKKQHKDMLEKMDQYLDQIHELESANRSMGTLTKMVEQYKDRAVELEREKFEHMSAHQMQLHECSRLNSELDKVLIERRQLEEELATLKESQRSTGVTEDPMSSGSGSGTFEVESYASLREKVHMLELELRLQAAGGSSSKAKDASDPDAASSNLSHEVELLKTDLDDMKRAKQEREEMLLATKKQLAEAQAEIRKIHADQANKAAANSAVSAASVRELEQKLATSANTLKLLEDRLKEKESTVNKLEQEKGKLENYARRTLAAFKDKYMGALNTVKAENKILQEKMAAINLKNEKNAETARREERLILSAMYEIGVRMMDKRIKGQALEPSQQTNKGMTSPTGALHGANFSTSTPVQK